MNWNSKMLKFIETMLWKEEKRFILGLYKWTTSEISWVLEEWIVPNAQIRELCGVTKGVGERINEGVLQWFSHVERMENDRIAKGVYVGECAGSRSVGRLGQRWIDTMNNCLRKRGLDIRQAKRVVQDRSEWQGFVRGNAWGITGRINP